MMCWWRVTGNSINCWVLQLLMDFQLCLWRVNWEVFKKSRLEKSYIKSNHDGFFTRTPDQMFSVSKTNLSTHKHRVVTKDKYTSEATQTFRLFHKETFSLNSSVVLQKRSCDRAACLQGFLEKHFSVASHTRRRGHLLNICGDSFCVCGININIFWASTDGFQFNIEYDRVHQLSEISTRLLIS